MAGVDENDNGAVLGLLHTLDQIKQDAGVHELYLLAHTGRGEQVEGRERARGATVLDDWADARWVLTREGPVRFLAVEGRSVVDMSATSLVFDEKTGLLRLGGENKAGARTSGIVQVIAQVVLLNPGVTQNGLKKLVAEAGGHFRDVEFPGFVQEAIELGYIRIELGGNRRKLHFPDGMRPVNDEGTAAGATPREANLARVRDEDITKESQLRRSRRGRG